MEMGRRAMELATRALNSKTLLNTGLIGVFGILSMRSLHQQKLIEALEAEKEALLTSNKAVKKTLWDSKQVLYAEAEKDNAVVPLSRLQIIFDDVPAASVNPGKGDGKPAPSKILI